MASSSSALNASAKTFVIMVDAEVKAERRDDFLDTIEKNSIGSRAEPGCLRFGEWLEVIL